MKTKRTDKECKEFLIKLSRPDLSEEEIDDMMFNRSLYAHAIEIVKIREFLGEYDGQVNIISRD